MAGAVNTTNGAGDGDTDQGQQSCDRAHARVQASKGFYIHASAYVLVNIALFVLKVTHHGSSTSSTPLFLSRFPPKIAVIQVGAEIPTGILPPRF